MGSSRLRVFDPHLERKDPAAAALADRELPLPTFDVPYFKYIDEEDEDEEWSSRSQSSTEEDSVDSLLSDRYVVVSGTPEKILEHLLNDLHLNRLRCGRAGFAFEKRITDQQCRRSSPGGTTDTKNCFFHHFPPEILSVDIACEVSFDNIL